MNSYTLAPEEVLLYRGEAQFKHNNTVGEVLLTSTNIVEITKTKKMFQKERVFVQPYAVRGVKFYRDAPKITLQNSTLEVQTADGTILLEFGDRGQARKFEALLFELLTGLTSVQRDAQRVRGTINVVDEALGINTMETIKNVASKGVLGSLVDGLSGVVAPKIQEPSAASVLLGAAKSLSGAANANEDARPTERSSGAAIDEQIEKLMKLKELLDSGTISQDEYEILKKRAIEQ